MEDKNSLIHQGGLGPPTAADLIAQGKMVRQITTSYVTAIVVPLPRDLKVVQKKCLEEANLGGETFFYRWPLKTKNKETGEIETVVVEGPSKNLAYCGIRNFGNVAVDEKPIQETRDAYIFFPTIIDIETGFTYTRPFRISKKYPVRGKHDEFRKDDIRFQIGVSKGQRNAIINFLPSGLVHRMIHEAKNSVRNRIEKEIAKDGIEKVRERIVQAFVKLKVDPDVVCQSYELQVDQWDIETLVILAGDLHVLRSGEETGQTLYGTEIPAEYEVVRQEKDGSSLSEKDMSPGDPATHQDVKADQPDQKPEGGGQQGKLGDEF